MIRNPNDIVEKLVDDYLKAFQEQLVSVVLYGSAVTHEHIPGKSEIEILVVLADASIEQLHRCSAVQARWMRRGVSVPRFLTRSDIAAAKKTFTVELLHMQHGYRVLYGEDELAGIVLDRTDLKLQAARMLQENLQQARTDFVRFDGQYRLLQRSLTAAIGRLLPVFKALLILNDGKLPNAQAEIVAAIEDMYGFGPSVLSDIQCDFVHAGKDMVAAFDQFTRRLEFIDSNIDKAYLVKQH